MSRLILLLFALFCFLQASCLAADQRSTPARPPAPLSEEQKIIHALNRLAFGPRPGDVERVRQMGLKNWIEEQLAPATIDDSTVEAKLAPLTTLQLPASQLLIAYLGDTVVALRQANRQKMVQEKTAKGEVTAAEKPQKTLTPRQLQIQKMIEESGLPPRASLQAVGELLTSKTVRAVESKRQLQEVLVDFWSNHFNVDVKRATVRALKIVDDRAAIRPHVFGKFRDLLGATAHSPAMLIYLDNARSTVAKEAPRRANQKTRGGINENYARELMELHTLGVDGGYTQQDVQEVARCLTGWTVNLKTGEFIFRPMQHDNGAKTVLGHAIAAGGGIGDGEAVLDILAAHPATARFIARKLCVRLVTDEPPATLIDRAAKTFQDTGGDLREVVRTIVLAPEFNAPQAYQAKFKSPFEYAVSATRALGGKVIVPDPAERRGRLRLIADGSSSIKRMNNPKQLKGRQKSLVQQIGTMGQPLFSCQPPTGYSEDSRYWMSTSGLISRLTFALAMTSNEVEGVQTSLTGVLADVDRNDGAAVLNRLSTALLGNRLSPTTRATLEKQIAGETPVNATKLAALLIGSPEYQRR
ncbi:MAG TPA: DUF1800 domain-containing protein [Abditibacteriaceae bacterium]|nr:DUF1800 domain-containing protein [Abditibacteriaceae bacterium]